MIKWIHHIKLVENRPRLTTVPPSAPTGWAGPILRSARPKQWLVNEKRKRLFFPKTNKIQKMPHFFRGYFLHHSTTLDEGPATETPKKQVSWALAWQTPPSISDLWCWSRQPNRTMPRGGGGRLDQKYNGGPTFTSMFMPKKWTQKSWEISWVINICIETRCTTSKGLVWRADNGTIIPVEFFKLHTNRIRGGLPPPPGWC